MKAAWNNSSTRRECRENVRFVAKTYNSTQKKPTASNGAVGLDRIKSFWQKTDLLAMRQL